VVDDLTGARSLEFDQPGALDANKWTLVASVLIIGLVAMPSLAHAALAAMAFTRDEDLGGLCFTDQSDGDGSKLARYASLGQAGALCLAALGIFVAVRKLGMGPVHGMLFGYWRRRNWAAIAWAVLAGATAGQVDVMEGLADNIALVVAAPVVLPLLDTLSMVTGRHALLVIAMRAGCLSWLVSIAASVFTGIASRASCTHQPFADADTVSIVQFFAYHTAGPLQIAASLAFGGIIMRKFARPNNVAANYSRRSACVNTLHGGGGE
jgi:hypothetical protein